MSQSTVQVKDLDEGFIIDFEYWTLFHDDDKDVEVLSIVGKDGVVYTTISATFKANFFRLVDIFNDESFSIIKLSGKTNAGRDYVNCDLAD